MKGKKFWKARVRMRYSCPVFTAALRGKDGWGTLGCDGAGVGMAEGGARMKDGFSPPSSRGRLFAGKTVGGQALRGNGGLGGQNGVGLRGRAVREPPLREGREGGWGRSGRLRRRDSSTPLRSAQNDMGVERMNFGRRLHRGRLSTRAKRRRMRE